jgi:hypothetical protein
MHTELYSFNVFIIFQDTETVSERDVSMVDALEGSRNLNTMFVFKIDK